MTFKMRYPPDKWDIERTLMRGKFKDKNLNDQYIRITEYFENRQDAFKKINLIQNDASEIKFSNFTDIIQLVYYLPNPDYLLFRKEAKLCYSKARKLYKEWLVSNKDNIVKYKNMKLEQIKARREQAKIKRLQLREAAILKRAENKKKRDLKLLHRLHKDLEIIKKRIGKSSEVLNKQTLKSMGFGRKLDI